ncbi:MAG: GTP-binding protein TypA/BipA [Candidatus Yanofskybacteria bacterium GW2011_GWF1_44_227]|uniref:50S ribosomal subunit assembly factor BipA n=1 Tax=Candidatus Yanofskybacteria bacterium GW2011_GWE2_40_11 TaxID=1619033 RepID=A0A0G0T2A9_9BACT|nr:MAG: GTP-binding protein TypA/BipA [Candidatus Yanofskybacteria bacterium GW2011_GWE1_40_10]KKR41225.1 MAG: GTP-binding protein TypA/BipA [Candidatus Yanofskybacteria bacterium GW2011_GWE2_40_11]KKT15700.1 MAG: GTP-binding protein TypA/BipA [Candidatus Yanofskybacteria bacterium GW2011_GWF2_43_596]KKT53412.1 MAG: GTP-binding protein TypA/BipA [Candidatus Yanofskybacteria bacterium GW2011_GWF1_44_227]OGN36177.1 MAG: GTP-binding protein TypA [Candidatus Yanofskybacteria bacterium RIFOXYA2_FULL
MEIRNIAIIAHVDHGKTALTDALMKQTGMVEEGFSMDSNDLERERGITIYSKNASLFYKGTKINIVDTPGHADFSSEVERVLRSIDTVLLVVDAQEGPMPQTKFVLKKSLELGLKPIVVINKIDKPAADPKQANEDVLELFMDLGANDEQLDFKTVYAIGRDGIAKNELHHESVDLTPLLDTILLDVPAAKADTSLPLRLQPFNLAYDNFLGRLGIGRIYEGVIKTGSTVFVKQPNGITTSGKITKLFTFDGMKRKEVEQAEAGDIVMVAGLPDIYIGETLCDSPDQELLPSINVDEPTISLNFLVNDSPFAGREGKFVTTRQIRERLEKELEVNIGLKIDFNSNEFYKVYGRGELHIAILLENMRREGYELQVSQPQVITKDVDGVKHEPYEEAIIDVPDLLAGVVIQKLGKRSGIMTAMQQHHGETRLTFEVPTRGLLGFRNEFIIDTRGEGILSSRFIGFRPHVGDIKKKETGSMVSAETGKALGFSLYNLQERGTLYIDPNTQVYEGMVIGNTAKGNDLNVNPIKGKKLTNMRASGSDENIILIPPLTISLERGLEVMSEDEYLEITPQSIRLRKKYLTDIDRIRAERKNNGN